MDLTNITFIGLAVLGFVNVVGFFLPDMDSKVKFGISVVFAFALTFVPPELGNIILDKAKIAIETALAVSGTYKLAQKVGGKDLREE